MRKRTLIPGEDRSPPKPTGSEICGKVSILSDPAERRGHTVDVERVHQDCGVACYFWYGSAARSNHRNARRHRLEDGEPEALIDRRIREHVRLSVFLCKVALAEPVQDLDVHTFLQAVPNGRSLVSVRAYNPKRCGHVATQQVHRVEQAH